MEVPINANYFDFDRVATHNGHITISAHNYMCGGKYQYNGIPSRKERFMFARSQSTYLKHIKLKDVSCEICKELQYQALLSKKNDIVA